MEPSIKAVKDAVQEIGQNFEQFKTEVEKRAKDGDVLVEEKIKKLGDAIALKLEEHQKEIDRMNAIAQRPGAATGGEVNKAQVHAVLFAKMRRDAQREHRTDFEPDIELTDRYTKAFEKYCRAGKEMMSPEEMKDMSVGSDPDGGYFVTPPTIADNVLVRIFETSPMRQICSVMPIGTREFIQPEDPADIGVGWVTERQSRPTTATTQPSRKVIVAQEEYAEPQVTQQLLEDSMIDITAYLAERIADKLSRNENAAFVNGNGVGKPTGFLSYPAGQNWGQIEQIKSTSAGAFVYEGLISLITSIKDAYQARANFLVRRQSVSAIMTLKDGNGRYIFQPILNGNFNDSPLLGYPLKYATDMPDIGSGALALAFGDFKAGYQIVDRVGLSTIRDNLTAKPNVLFYTRKRVGGDVVNFDAIKLQVLSA